MKLKVGDKVVVITGKDRGKEGKITTVLRDENRVVVEGVNIVKKHIKPAGQNPGSIVDREASVHASNVKCVESKPKAKAKVEHTTEKKVSKVKTVKKSSKKID